MTEEPIEDESADEADDEQEDRVAPGEGASDGEETDGLARLRMASVIAELKEKAGGYLTLEGEIKEALAKAPGGASSPTQEGAPCVIGRRKLKKIVENDPKLVLSIAELRGLDQYLENVGQSLAVKPLFEKPELFRTIAESQHAVFLLGSKRDPNDNFRINISHWDVLGLSSIQAGLQGYEKNLRLDIREARLHEHVGQVKAELDSSGLEELYAERGPSIVCLASSLGNPLAERTLSEMAGFEPWRSDVGKDRFDLPFHFVWPSERRYLLPSRFHLDPEDVRAEGDADGQRIVDHRAAGFRYAGNYLVDELTIKGTLQGYTYALCAAQRREKDQAWLVVAGLTGPATYAAARWVGNMRTRFDEESKPGQTSRVSWKLLRALARREEGEDGWAYNVGPAKLVASGYGLGPKG